MFDLGGLDPRCRIVLLAGFSSLGMLLQQPLYLLFVLAATWLLLLLGRAQIADIVRQVKGIFWLIAVLFILQSFFVRTGEPLLVIKGLTLVTSGGFTMACMLTLRLLIIVSSALIMLSGDVRDYLLALVQWRIPYEIAFMTMASIHFIPILRDEGLNVFYAVQLRGSELKKTSLKQKLQLYLRISLPILAGALNRTKAMAIAMEARAFRAYPQRTYLRRLELSRVDWLILIMVPVLTAAVVIWLRVL